MHVPKTLSKINIYFNNLSTNLNVYFALATSNL